MKKKKSEYSQEELRWSRFLITLDLVLILFAVVLLVRTSAAVQKEPSVEPQRSPSENSPAVQQGVFEVGREDVLIPAGRNGQPVQLHATAWWPEGADAVPLVLLCHGFTGSRQGDGHFAPLAAALAEKGIASIAVDFPGNGESEEPFTAYTVEAMQSDLRAAALYMAEMHQADTARLGMVGHSMGGRLVSLSLSNQVMAAALWSPADNVGLHGIEFLDHTSEGRAALLQTAQEQGSVELPQWGVTVGRAFLEEMAASDPTKALSRYRGRLLVAFSGGDPELLSQETIDRTLHAAKSGDPDMVNLYGLYENATHNYNAASGKELEDREICACLENETARFLCEVLLDPSGR